MSDPPNPPRPDDHPVTAPLRPYDEEPIRPPHHLHVMFDWLQRQRRRRTRRTDRTHL